MKIYSLIPALCVALYAGSASAQNWFEYDNREDLFTVNFPEQPTVTQQEYISEYDSPFPSNIYSASDGMTSYRVTVVDMENSARAPGRRGTEWRGSVDFEAAKLRRTGEVTFDAYAEINVVPGHQLQITLPDGSRNFANIHFHMKRLYIIEAISPGNLPPPAHFQASFAVIDGQGNRLRYLDDDYSFPDYVPLARRGDAPVANNDDVIAIGEAQNPP